MNFYIKKNINGKILAKYKISPETVKVQKLETWESFIEITEEIFENIINVDDFVFNINKNIVEKIPSKPENFYKFNYKTLLWEIDNNNLIEELMRVRSQLLINSDWTDTVSAQTRLTNYAEWQTYRQSLRDIPSQSGYPENVIWPEQPK